jgi:predicted amidophosphoribosyltransferase
VAESGLRQRLGAAVDIVLDVVLPPRCVACATPLDGTGDDWCDACAEQLTPSPLPGLLLYGGSLPGLIQRAKYSRDVGAARALSRLMAERIDVDAGAIDVVTFVPAHWTRGLARGFDLPALLADSVAQRLGVPARALLVAGRRDRRLASSSSVEERASLVAGRFRARAVVSGVRALLIDDVHTTGATLTEASATLIGAGARDVVVRTLALTPAQERDAWQAAEKTALRFSAPARF